MLWPAADWRRAKYITGTVEANNGLRLSENWIWNWGIHHLEAALKSDQLMSGGRSRVQQSKGGMGALRDEQVATQAQDHMERHPSTVLPGTKSLVTYEWVSPAGLRTALVGIRIQEKSSPSEDGPNGGYPAT
ncbi:hypothetical protein Tsubulata_008672 [Turnera subulata]|uniref:Uncharacterized protein n=1 Tax=Turnera subulata TaxID=218843 RepID=A0A9Q0F553_9ROSI|nr:hypothetical protein Tsubulata_008672 [Turnera subulata]